MTCRPDDADARMEALDPTRSFIVQAPAGSGKTELLTRRVLTLLAKVDRPEEIVAITFTRKAAAEMRHRVVGALRRASNPAPAESPFEAERLEIARQALARDRELGWQLVDDPTRLTLHTIDAFAGQLARGLPVASGLGGNPRIMDNASDLYRVAAERFLERDLSTISRVSGRLDNRLPMLCDRFAALLGIRDQWQSYVLDDLGSDHLRDVLEGMLDALIASRLQIARRAAPPGLGASLSSVLKACRDYLPLLDEAGELADGLQDKHTELIAVAKAMEANTARLPGADATGLPLWQAIARLLVTGKGTWRSRFDKHAGVPAKGAAGKLGVPTAELITHKSNVDKLMQSLEGEASLLTALHEIVSLPEPRYKDADWLLIGELGDGLRLLLTELQRVFAERGEVDFTEIAQRARQALGDKGVPTDLSLAMDMNPRHLLVDEFQDTSNLQYALFERLIEQWVPGDGRTVFVVGDPMQSVYRFRQGDVGLFMRAIDEGIGPVSLHPLRLTVNFRSIPAVIDWINRKFSVAFPAQTDRDIGAVTYVPSSASTQVPEEPGTDVQLHLIDSRDDRDITSIKEGERVATLVAEALAEDTTGTVGVLLRVKAHALRVVDALTLRGISYRAVEIEWLGDRPVVRDLVALTLALRYPHDRLNWLALLRGPLCGLRLADLHALCADSDNVPVVELIEDETRQSALSDDGRYRLARFYSEIELAVRQAGRGALMPWVEAVWLRLGGPAMCRDDADLDAADRTFRKLAELESQDGLWSRQAISNAMSRLFAARDAAAASTARVQVMTMHKAKGLEFDTVVLPTLSTTGRGNERRLLDWFETTVDGRRSLLLAPIDAPHAPDAERSAIGTLLRGFRKRADEVERVRLLYVACTRARRRLHLVAALGKDESGDWKAPAANTLLAPLWPALKADAKTSVGAAGLNALSMHVDTEDEVERNLSTRVDGGNDPEPPLFERVVNGWTLPEFEQFDWQRAPPASIKIPRVDYDWSGSTARDVGTVIHRALQRLSELPAAARLPPDSNGIARLALELRTLGVTDDCIEQAMANVITGICNTLDDDRGRWLFDETHGEVRCEWALTVPTVDAGCVVAVDRVIVDRTFVDAGGIRWIIDYKTSSHEGGRLKEFLDGEVDHYRDQLQRYARLLHQIDPSRPIRIGLWFPMVRGWREFSAVEEGRGATIV